MAGTEMLRSQKNEVLEMIKRVELDPFQFEWRDHRSEFDARVTVPRLCYTEADYWFQFDMNGDKHYAIFCPGADKMVDHDFPGNWDLQRAYVSNWLSCLKRELDAPDLWDALAEYRLPPGSRLDPESENRPFSVQEVKQLTAGIGKIREYLECEFDGVESDLANITEKLDYLCEAAERQGRKDWFHTCIGVLFTLGSALGLTQVQGATLWTLLKGAVSGVVRLLAP